MANYEMSNEERAYLSGYDITVYERPSLAADMVVFSILNDGVSDNIRKLQKKSLKVLLIKRASYPYKDCWALPGGFCRPGEDVVETAKRELFEETNVKNAYLQLVGAFGEKNRDPRGWIVSNTFMALIDGEKCSPRAGTDAWEAKWFNIEVRQGTVKKETKEDSVSFETKYELSLVSEDKSEAQKATEKKGVTDCEVADGFRLTAHLKEIKSYENYHETVHYEIADSGDIAFDHAKIILAALLSLRENVENNLKLAFDLMPECFTLTELQNAFEIILDKKLLTANFRRKIADYVLETDKIIEGAGYRPAKLFKRNIEMFYG